MADPEIIVSTVGRLVGDTWMLMPSIVDLSKIVEIKVIAGTYAHPVVDFVRESSGRSFEIIETIEDPDVETNPFCPGFGGPSILAAKAFIKGKYPNSGVIAEGLASNYNRKREPLLLDSSLLKEGNYIVVQAYTRHDWKNCNGVLREVPWSIPVVWLGLPGEPVGSGIDATKLCFDAQAKLMLGAKMVVSVLSSWSAAASIFGKRQFVAAFTEDVHAIRSNERATHLVNPTVEQIREHLKEEGVC